MNGVWCSVAIKLAADIDEILDGGHVNIIDRREIKDDGLERGQVRAVRFALARARTWVVPRAVTWTRPGVRVGASSGFENVLYKVVSVVTGVWIV